MNSRSLLIEREIRKHGEKLTPDQYRAFKDFIDLCNDYRHVKHDMKRAKYDISERALRAELKRIENDMDVMAWHDETIQAFLEAFHG